MNVHCAAVEHKHGVNIYASRTEEGLNQQLYKYVKEWWEKDGPEDEDGKRCPIPNDPFDTVEQYFNWQAELGNGESINYAETELGD